MSGGMTPNELAHFWRCSANTIRTWIRNGQLKAMNVATKGKPRFIILPKHMEEFEARMEVKTEPKATRKRKPKKPWVEYV